MAVIKSVRLPIDYIYLDRPGIESLYSQIVNRLETSRTTTTQKGVTGKAGAKLGLKNLVLKLLSGLEAEVSAEVTGSLAVTEQATKVQAVEHRLAALLNYLSKSGEGCLFTDLAGAIRHSSAADGPVFVNIRDTFNAPQFYGRATGSDLVNAEGYLVLEKGGVEDHRYSDDYYKQPSGLIRVSASITKIRGGSGMSATGHEAVYFRGFGGQHVPLSIFGTLIGASEYFQIKPFAIWK
jgi:hypothetical protein